MSKHTPTPWKVAINQVNNHPEVQIYHDRKNDKGQDLSLPDVICRYSMEHYSGGDNKANAQLIASAPELLEACKATMDCFVNDLPVHFLERYKGLIDILNQAITKAEVKL